jgi:hypothetical protein
VYAATLNPTINVTAGAPQYILQAQGEDFAAGDILQWNGSGMSTTLADATRMDAVLPGSMVQGGNVSLQVMTSEGELSEPLTFTINLIPDNFGSARAYPNPWRSDRHTIPLITFDRLPLGSTVKIFTVSGRFVKTLPVTVATATWDLTNDNGDRVASGIYLYLLEANGNTKTGQLTVVR